MPLHVTREVVSRNRPVCSVPVESLGGMLLGALHDEAVTLGQDERTVEKKNLCNNLIY